MGLSGGINRSFPLREGALDLDFSGPDLPGDLAKVGDRGGATPTPGSVLKETWRFWGLDAEGSSLGVVGRPNPPPRMKFPAPHHLEENHQCSQEKPMGAKS